MNLVNMYDHVKYAERAEQHRLQSLINQARFLYWFDPGSGDAYNGPYVVIGRSEDWYMEHNLSDHYTDEEYALLQPFMDEYFMDEVTDCNFEYDTDLQDELEAALRNSPLFATNSDFERYLRYPDTRQEYWRTAPIRRVE